MAGLNDAEAGLTPGDRLGRAAPAREADAEDAARPADMVLTPFQAVGLGGGATGSLLTLTGALSLAAGAMAVAAGLLAPPAGYDAHGDPLRRPSGRPDMIARDIALGVLSLAGAGLGTLHLRHLVRLRGPGRPASQSRVERPFARAPVHRLAGMAAE